MFDLPWNKTRRESKKKPSIPDTRETIDKSIIESGAWKYIEEQKRILHDRSIRRRT